MPRRENLAEFEKRRAELEKAQTNSSRRRRSKRGEARGARCVQVTQKAGVDGKLFGSVTNVDIAEALKNAGLRRAEGRDPHAARAAEERSAITR